MLSRQLVKTTLLPRILYHVINQKTVIFEPSCMCFCDRSPAFRTLTTSTTVCKDDKTWKRDTRHSATSTKKNPVPLATHEEKRNIDKSPAATVSNTRNKKISNTTSDEANTENATKSTNSKAHSKKVSNKMGYHKTGNTGNMTMTTPVNEEEVLEKFIAGLSSDIYSKRRVYKNYVQKVVGKVKDAKFSTKKQGLLLLSCCTELLPDESPKARMLLAEEIWNAIKPHTKFDVDHYNELLRVYLANRRTVEASKFIDKMAPVIPNFTTYELLLKVIGEAGDIDQATEVISNMKVNNLPATESIFSSLIVCQGKAGKIDNLKEVLLMMKSLKIEQTVNTYVALARAYAFNQNGQKILEEIHKGRAAGIEFDETHIMEIVKTMAENNLLSFIPKVLKYLPSEVLNTPSISPYMQVTATQLVFMNQPMAALELYKCLPVPTFGPKDDHGLHGRGLVRDCVKASMPCNLIALITQDLMASGRNPIALQNAAEAALQLGRTPLSLDLFLRMKQLGLPLRCHYYWPILLQNMKSLGEKGIMTTLQTMIMSEVPPDYETVIDYALPYVSFASPQNLMKKFLEINLTVPMVLTPMIVTLVSNGQVQAARDLCELFQGKVDIDKLIQPLVRGHQISMNLKDTMNLLEEVMKRALDSSKDWVGRFLCTIVKQKRINNDYHEILSIIQEIQQRGLNITSSAAEFCLSRVPEELEQEKKDRIKEVLLCITDERLLEDGELFDQAVPHPKQMNEEALSAHLKELEAKGMNTRGVLRKLLQQYCRSGNLVAAKEIVDRCKREGIFLSVGMKAAIFDLHVKLGDLDEAELALADLTKSSPNFLLDEYKVIDFATLMAYRGRIDKAFELINSQSTNRKIIGGKSISMNCWRLLDTVALYNSHVETRNMFELITSLGYCKPTNVMLGPLIRVYLKQNNLEEAVNEFIRVANKYNTTPLKHALLCKILQQMSDGVSEENFLTNAKCNGRLNKIAQKILTIAKKIHGASDVQLSVVSALAEVGYKKTLRTVFLDPTVKFHPDAFLRRCERFADEKKVEPLETLAECCADLRHIDVADIYDLILDVYQRQDAVDKALSLWTKMHEQDVIPSEKFVRTLCGMAKANNRHVPPEIAALNQQQFASLVKT